MTTGDDYGRYQAAVEGDWDYLKKFFKEKPYTLLSPLSATGYNAFHLAVFSNGKQPLKYLLGIASNNDMTKYAYWDKNVYGDTALHEAAANGNLEAVKLLVDHNKELSNENTEFLETEFLEDINEKGETPLFQAAAYGKTKVVKFLTSEPFEQLINRTEYEFTETGERKIVEVTKLKDIHRQIITRNKRKAKPEPSKPPTPLEEETIEVHGASILHVAVQETALLLLKLDKGLATLKDKNGWTSLHLLATMPSAFKSGYQMGTWISRVFYFCVRIDDRVDDDDDEKGSCFNLFKCLHFGDSVDDKELCCLNLFKGSWILGKICSPARKVGWWIQGKICSPARKIGWWIQGKICSPARKIGWWILGKICSPARKIGWWILGKICSPARKICEAKRKHKLAFRLAKRLIEEGSWIDERMLNISSSPDDEEDSKPSPLFMATERGVIKIVKQIITDSPDLVECKNHLKQNILHVSIKHRRKKIFDLVKRMKISMRRLVRGIDKNGYTILHHAANTRDDTREIHPSGPVYELQEELKWYKRVEKITPPHYRMLPDSKDNKTCEELFNMKHNELLKRAQQWIKETSQSCSAVSVLVATVVFAAAYTVPGGSNDKGYPVFLNNNFFLIFTVMDVVALACSLTSVVMFLSILTSPFNYEEFLHRLPRKLTIGFSLLFIALTTTMLAFAATLLLIVRFQKPRWTTTLIYSAAFLPVSIFALTQFPMYVAFKVTLLKFCKWIKKVPMNDVSSKKNDDNEAGSPV